MAKRSTAKSPLARQIERRGIRPEKASPSHKVNSIGKSTKNGRWYGWSHRAISDFRTREEAVRFARSVS
jgi:hypothetical protein